MKEQLVSFETAKLAKEKGFKELCFYYYDNKGKLEEPYLENGSSTDVEFRVDLSDLLENHNWKWYNKCSAPTQSLLQKWLREVYGIHINIDFGLQWGYQLIHIGSSISFSEEFIDGENWLSYEEALEAGLQIALNLIKEDGKS